MQQVLVWMGFILFFSAAQTSAALAQDIKGARDHALVKRFPGSTIVRYEKRTSADYTVPMGPILKWDYARAQPDFGGKKADLVGDVTRITYVVRSGVSAAEVFRSLVNELAARGFKPLYQASGADFGRSQGNLYQNIAGQLLEYSPQRAHFVSAKLDSLPATVHIALYFTEYEIGTTPIKIRRGQVVAHLDVVEEQPTSDKLVVVSASEILKGLESSGRVALYGILFDTNKAEIKTESRPALDEVAKYLRSNPPAKLDVVGHTDNIGSYDSNLDLSRARAAAVVGALVREYDVNPQRLRASGVGFLAPMASNTTDVGRAKNRRVELLPQ